MGRPGLCAVQYSVIRSCYLCIVTFQVTNALINLMKTNNPEKRHTEAHSRNYFCRGKSNNIILWGATRWRSWLGHCATSREVAGSIPDGVIEILHWHNPSGRTMALRLTASNRNEYQECFLWVKAAGSYGWQPYHLHFPIVLKSGSLNHLEPSGPLQVCNGIALPILHIMRVCLYS